MTFSLGFLTCGNNHHPHSIYGVLWHWNRCPARHVLKWSLCAEATGNKANAYIQDCHCGAPLAIPLRASQCQGWMVAMSPLWCQTIGSCTSLQRWALIRTITHISIIQSSLLNNLARNGMLYFYSVLRKCKTLTVLLQSLHQAYQQSWFPEGLLQWNIAAPSLQCESRDHETPLDTPTPALPPWPTPS